jgi:hypothetical protein
MMTHNRDFPKPDNNIVSEFLYLKEYFEQKYKILMNAKIIRWTHKIQYIKVDDMQDEISVIHTREIVDRKSFTFVKCFVYEIPEERSLYLHLKKLFNKAEVEFYREKLGQIQCQISVYENYSGNKYELIDDIVFEALWEKVLKVMECDPDITWEKIEKMDHQH